MHQLDKGILLEDKKTFLPWGQPLDKLAFENNAEVLKLADRLIINWGIHTILGGLELNLTESYIGIPDSFLNKEFECISSWVIGDKQAKEFFSSVGDHLSSIFGMPQKEYDLEEDREICHTWFTEGADIVFV